MRYGSVCSGIESASVAWGPLGWQAAWFAENDKACARHLAKRFPGVTNHGDMTALPEMVRRGEIEAPDVLVGGTPCQDFSVAGMRRGLAGARGQLTMTYVELADAIDEQRPGNECVVCWENVPGVLNHKDNPFGNFLAALVGENVPLVPSGKRWTDVGVVLGPRRAVAWRCLDAQYFGLAQRRKRVFVVASARAGFDPAAVLFEREGVRRDTAPRREAGQGLTHAVAPCLKSSGRGVERTGDPRGQDAVVAVRAYGGGNCAGPIAAAAALNANERYDFDSETFVVDVCPTLRAGGNSTGGDRPPGTDVDTADSLIAVLPFDTTQVTSVANRSSPRYGDPCHPLAAGAHAPAIAFTAKDYAGDATTEMAPTLRSMGHSGSHANGGGQVAVCVTGDVTHTLKAEGFDASEDGTGRGQPIVAFMGRGSNIDIGQEVTGTLTGNIDRASGSAPCVTVPCGFQSSQSGVRVQQVAGTLDSNYGSRRHNGVLYPAMAVRRLMPVECERLQGFPDGWTDGQADGPRYKQLGNSKAVPVVRWIGRRIKAEMRRGFVSRLQELSRALGG